MTVLCSPGNRCRLEFPAKPTPGSSGQRPRAANLTPEIFRGLQAAGIYFPAIELRRLPGAARFLPEKWREFEGTRVKHPFQGGERPERRA